MFDVHAYPMHTICANCGDTWGHHYGDRCPVSAVSIAASSDVAGGSVGYFVPPVPMPVPDPDPAPAAQPVPAAAPASDPADPTPTYRVERYSLNAPKTLVMSGVTLEEAKAWCSRDDTHGDGWFDAWTAE